MALVTVECHGGMPASIHLHQLIVAHALEFAERAPCRVLGEMLEDIETDGERVFPPREAVQPRRIRQWWIFHQVDESQVQGRGVPQEGADAGGRTRQRVLAHIYAIRL